MGLATIVTFPTMFVMGTETGGAEAAALASNPPPPKAEVIDGVPLIPDDVIAAKRMSEVRQPSREAGSMPRIVTGSDTRVSDVGCGALSSQLRSVR